MADALLTVDCGNSTISCLDDAGQRWSTSSRGPDFSSLAAFVGARAPRVLAVSVVAAALSAVTEAFSAIGLEVEVAGEHLPCPLRLDYETVETLGADRWLGAFAAHRRFGAAVTVDCGTATTVNVVTHEGVFRGGAIAPGLDAFVAGMTAAAPALPAADLDAAAAAPASSTQACVDAGVLIGWAGMVERLVGEARAGAPDAALVVTGGNATRLAPRLTLACEHHPDLLHQGLRALAVAPR
ncbi:MAG: type III pantothenate kinase [Planctomycetota bacterium]|nr:type III pantothenate kinase [Planctomycetota bacterium]